MRRALLTAAPVAAHGSVTFSFTGAVQSWTVPAGVTSIHVVAVGAAGGDFVNTGSGKTGGKGGRVEGSIAVTPGEELGIYVGGKGWGDGSGANFGGFNGGAGGGGSSAASGGGATDIRRGGSTLGARILVAGGGGGGNLSNAGGDGGGTAGSAGGGGTNAGKGGTQSKGGAGGGASTSYPGQPGALGVGGSGYDWGYGREAGGGGGYYGGGGAGGSFLTGGGGGGSSYLGVLTNATTTAGVNSGDGSITFTY